MNDPLNQDRVSLIERLKRARQAGFAVLMLERLSSALWRMLAWIGFFAGLWMLQGPQIFGHIGTILAWFVFIGGLSWLAGRDVTGLRQPEARDIDRRLEQAGGLAHRPLTVLDDLLANPREAATRTLWQSGKMRALAAIRQLRLPSPRPLLAARDPMALRVLALLLFIIGVIVAGPQAGSRIQQGLMPFSLFGGKSHMQDVSLWITPPGYTGQKVIAIQGGRLKAPLVLPAGSMVKARVGSGWFTPKLVMGKTSVPFKPLEDGNWTVETVLQPGKHIVIRRGLSKKADIAYDYRPDTPPAITVNGDPKVMAQGQWQFDATVKDDYGVTALTLNMTLDPSVKDAPLGKPVKDTRPVMIPGGNAVNIKPVYDMTWHTWAGLPVVVTLEAVDHEGHKAVTPPMKLTLPQRAFHHPVATALIGLRKRLAWTPETSAPNVAFDLQTILNHPASYGGDIAVFLSLRSASSRLTYTPTVESAEAVVPQLWDTAVTVEDGKLPLAARDFRQAQQDLEKLLSDPNATPDQIAAAMEKLRTAMGQYLSQAVQQMQKNMAANGIQPFTPEELQNIIRPEDIQAFLDQLQAQALTGDKNAARQMLSQLSDMANMFDPSMNTEVPKDLKFMADAMRQMQDLAQKQQALMEQTRSAKSPEDNKKQQAAQQELIDQLEKLMVQANDALNNIPQNMQDADKAMREASKKLGNNESKNALVSQQQAVDALRKGQGEMSEQMKQRIKQMMMMAFGSGNVDPLGHPRDDDGNGMFPGSQIKIPDQANRKKVQDIMRILRQRSGDLSRPDYELDYYRRLMRQF